MGSAWAGQVRLWRTERTKDEILRFMRISGSEELMNQRQDMIAYWDFNEPDDDRQASCAALMYAFQNREESTGCSSSRFFAYRQWSARLCERRRCELTPLRQLSCLRFLQVRPLRAPMVCCVWHLMGRVLCSAGAKTQVHQIAKDISGHGNDLPLITPPARKDMVIKKV